MPSGVLNGPRVASRDRLTLEHADIRCSRGHDAVALGVSRKQLGSLTAAGVIVHELADTYRMTASVGTPVAELRATLYAWSIDTDPT